MADGLIIVAPDSTGKQLQTYSNTVSSQTVHSQAVTLVDANGLPLSTIASHTNVMKTGSLVTTAVTADQVILTYTVTSGKTFWLTYLSINVRLTTFATTATNFGNASLENPSGTKILTHMNSGSGITASSPYSFPDYAHPIAAGTVIRVVCTPSATTSFTWQVAFGGYERNT